VNWLVEQQNSPIKEQKAVFEHVCYSESFRAHLDNFLTTHSLLQFSMVLSIQTFHLS